MDTTADLAAKAAAMHEKIVAALENLRATKVDVYFLLRAFHEAKLFRHLDLPAAPRHAAKICAGRRFTTWEDYLESLGDAGICFSYFAELDRLCGRFGEEFVRLCAGGVPVRTRRLLLKAPERVAREIRSVASSNIADVEKLETIDCLAGLWRSEFDARDHDTLSGRCRVGRYRRYVADWETKLSQVVDAVERRPSLHRGGTFARELVAAWREVFEAHLALGERLARMVLEPNLTAQHGDFLSLVRDAWGPRTLGELSALPAMPPCSRATHATGLPPCQRRTPAEPSQAVAATSRKTVADALPRVGPPRRGFR